MYKGGSLFGRVFSAVLASFLSPVPVFKAGQGRVLPAVLGVSFRGSSFLRLKTEDPSMEAGKSAKRGTLPGRTDGRRAVTVHWPARVPGGPPTSGSLVGNGGVPGAI